MDRTGLMRVKNQNRERLSAMDFPPSILAEYQQGPQIGLAETS